MKENRLSPPTMTVQAGLALVVSIAGACAAVDQERAPPTASARGEEVLLALDDNGYGGIFDSYLSIPELGALSEQPNIKNWAEPCSGPGDPNAVAVLEGVVRDDSTGRGVSAVAVTLHAPWMDCKDAVYTLDIDAATTDENGRFQFGISRAQLAEQIRLALIIPRSQAKKHRLMLGRFDLYFHHEDYAPGSLRNCLPEAEAEVNLTPLSERLCLRWSAVDDETGRPIPEAWVVLEMLGYPAGPQKISLPTSLWSGPNERFRASIEADGYESETLEISLGSGIDERVFRLKNMPAAPRSIAAMEITHICMALDHFALNNGGRYPDALEMLIRPDRNGHTYLDVDEVPRDPWGNPYLYEPPRVAGGRIDYWVATYGKDGQPGGEGENMDIDNRSIRSRSRK